MGPLRATHRLHAVRAGLAAWRGLRSAARTSPDARAVAGSSCRGCATTRSCRARREGLRRYECFVRERGDGRVLLLELGVGEMTPGIITLPFWSMAAKLPDAHLFERKHLGRRGPGESLEAIQPGLAERGIITRTGPLYGRAYLTEQRTTSHSGARSSPCFTRFLLLAIRNRLVDKLVECCALLGGADGSHDWIPYDVAVLVDNVGGREREQV